MAVKRRKKSNLKIMIIIFTVILILLLACLIIISKVKTNDSQVDMEKANLEYKEKVDKEIKEDLSEKDELSRMQYYCASFFKLIDRGNYQEAYKLLYSDYKENYFPTLVNFQKYFEEYFPSDFGLSYTNMERLGDIYVLNVSVTDTVNGSRYGHNFDMYVVIKENALNDYVISFSRNSAVGEEE